MEYIKPDSLSMDKIIFILSKDNYSVEKRKDAILSALYSLPPQNSFDILLKEIQKINSTTSLYALEKVDILMHMHSFLPNLKEVYKYGNILKEEFANKENYINEMLLMIRERESIEKENKNLNP